MSFFSSVTRKKASPRKSAKSLEWKVDPKIQKEMEHIVLSLGMDHILVERMFCYRTTGSKARAYARIWAFPKIFQQVLDIEPAYVMEIISERYDRLDRENQTKVIIHELLHIPKNFSGSLLPHTYGHTEIEREVTVLFEKYKEDKA